MKKNVFFALVAGFALCVLMQDVGAVDVSDIGLPTHFSQENDPSDQDKHQGGHVADHEALADALHESHMDAYHEGFKAGHKKGFGTGHSQGLVAGFMSGVKHGREKIASLFNRAGEYISDFAENVKTGSEGLYEKAKGFWSGHNTQPPESDVNVVGNNMAPF